MHFAAHPEGPEAKGFKMSEIGLVMIARDLIHEAEEIGIALTMDEALRATIASSHNEHLQDIIDALKCVDNTLVQVWLDMPTETNE